MKTIYLGPDGSFSGLALDRALKVFGVTETERIDAIENLKIIPVLRDMSHSLAIAAMHTDAEGRVEDLFKSIMRLLDTGADITIGGAFITPIKFALMGRRGVNLKNAAGMISHIKGLGACSRIVASLEKSEEATSNSKAVLMVASESRFKNWLALAPLECAEKYGLEVVDEDVSDKPAVTEFYVFSNGVTLPKLNSECWRLLSFFDVLDHAGSLNKVTDAVKEYNFLYLNSIHRDGKNYRFVIEIECANEEAGQEAVRLIHGVALKAMSFVFPVLVM